jgi:hypothetical protein
MFLGGLRRPGPDNTDILQSRSVSIGIMTSEVCARPLRAARPRQMAWICTAASSSRSVRIDNLTTGCCSDLMLPLARFTRLAANPFELLSTLSNRSQISPDLSEGIASLRSDVSSTARGTKPSEARHRRAWHQREHMHGRWAYAC